LPVHKLKTKAKELQMGSGQKVYHLPDWHSLSHPQRLAVIRQIAMMRGRDPRIAKLTVKILKKAGARPRQYKKQAAAILRWVQDPENVYYVNEPGERLQDPIYTIKAGHGDCDDQALIMGCLFESIGLPWKLCLSGRNKVTNEKLRHIEGDPVPPDCTWAHIYAMVGDKPFRPNKWYFAEPTVEGVPLGWDVISGDHSYLPEMAKPKKSKGPAKIAKLKSRPAGYKRGPLPKKARNQSPVYQMAHAGDYGAVFGEARPNPPLGQVSAAVGASVAEEMTRSTSLDWNKVMGAIATGVAVSIGTQIALDFVRGKGLWEGSGSIAHRWGSATATLSQTSVLHAPSPFKSK
jgi:hypothetical protein